MKGETLMESTNFGIFTQSYFFNFKYLLDFGIQNFFFFNKLYHINLFFKSYRLIFFI